MVRGPTRENQSRMLPLCSCVPELLASQTPGPAVWFFGAQMLLFELALKTNVAWPRYWPILFTVGGDIQFETPTLYTSLRTPAFCDHNAYHFYSGVWIGSRGGVDRVSVASLALERCARIRTEMTLLHMQVSMGELRLRLLSLRFDLLLCCTYHTTVNNLLLNSFSTKRNARLYKKRRYVDSRQDM